ncbi:MAG: hypothetical protein IIV28_00490, partial [Alistipes sp.]|nr:hypothetical protein [Alistipes sp.]
MKKLSALMMFLACIGLFISCEEEVNPTYVFPTPETTPTVTITPVEKGTDYITVRFSVYYADQCAYLYTEGESLSKSIDQVFAEGTIVEGEKVDVKIENLTPATAYTFIAAAKDELHGSVCVPVTVITASDAPESNYPKRMTFEPFERSF